MPMSRSTSIPDGPFSKHGRWALRTSCGTVQQRETLHQEREVEEVLRFRGFGWIGLSVSRQQGQHF